MMARTNKNAAARARSQAEMPAKKLAGPIGDSQPAAVPEVAHEYVALRAYYMFLSRGATPGRDLDDWLQAERELLTSPKSSPRD
jgi:Protein of unknown function (DUF2934)